MRTPHERAAEIIDNVIQRTRTRKEPVISYERARIVSVIIANELLEVASSEKMLVYYYQVIEELKKLKR
jgi:Mg2+/Co2+ transporter CorC